MNSILVIEDDVDTLENIEEVLELQNFRTMATRNSLMGLELAKEETPDLVICDVGMPNLNGFEVLSRLRQNTITAAIPFIFLTGRSDREAMRRGMELGADDYLTKPFTNEELVGSVKSCLDRHARLVEQCEAKVREVETLKKQLQLSQELAEMNGVLLRKISQGLRHPVSNISIATFMLKQNLNGNDYVRYLAILEEECAHSTSLLNEISSLQECLNPSKLNLLRGKLKLKSSL